MFVCCVGVVYLPPTWGIVLAIAAATGGPTLLHLINTIDLVYREKPWLRPSFHCFDWPALWTMLKHGVNLFILSMSVVALFQSDKLIIGAAIEPAAVAGYEVLGRVFLSAYGLFTLVLSPLWPAYGDAIHRGDYLWVKRQIRRTRIAGVGMMLMTGVIMLLVGNRLIHFWTRGQDLNVSRTLIAGVASMFIVRSWVDCQSVPLNAANVLTPQIFWFGGHALLNIVVSLLAVHVGYGVEGVAWSTTITGLVTTVWAYPFLVRKYIARPAQAAAERQVEQQQQQQAGASRGPTDMSYSRAFAITLLLAYLAAGTARANAPDLSSPKRRRGASMPRSNAAMKRRCGKSSSRKMMPSAISPTPMLIWSSRPSGWRMSPGRSSPAHRTRSLRV